MHVDCRSAGRISVRGHFHPHAIAAGRLGAVERPIGTRERGFDGLPCQILRDADRARDRNVFRRGICRMLLDLLAARLERERVSVSSLCIAAAVPPTTALRWIRTLTDKGCEIL